MEKILFTIGGITTIIFALIIGVVGIKAVLGKKDFPNTKREKTLFKKDAIQRMSRFNGLCLFTLALTIFLMAINSFFPVHASFDIPVIIAALTATAMIAHGIYMELSSKNRKK